MDTYLVRLKTYDPRRGHVLRRYTYRGIKLQEERGWYRVSSAVADYLKEVRQQPTDEHSPPAFDVCTDAEAKALEAKEMEDSAVRKGATDRIAVSSARGAVTTEDIPDDKDSKQVSEDKSKSTKKKGQKG